VTFIGNHKRVSIIAFIEILCNGVELILDIRHKSPRVVSEFSGKKKKIKKKFPEALFFDFSVTDLNPFICSRQGG